MSGKSEMLSQSKRARADTPPSSENDALDLRNIDTADFLDAKAIDTDFHEAVDYVMKNPIAARLLSDDLQRTLYGLFQVGMYGPALSKFPGVDKKGGGKASYQAKEQYDAHKDAGKITAIQAKEKYCQVLIEAIPDYMFRDENEEATKEERPAEDLPENMRRAVEEKLGLKSGQLDKKTDSMQAEAMFFTAIENGLLDMMITQSAAIDITTVTDSSGLTPLMVACDRAHPEIVQWLLKSGKCEVNAVDPDNQTALHYAVILESVPLVTMLLSAGAKTDVKDSDGYTPSDVAKDSGSAAITLALESNN